MKVLSFLILRPGGPRFGGAADAARLLSTELTEHVDLDFAEMSDRDETESWQGTDYIFVPGFHGIPALLRKLIPPLRHRFLNVFTFSKISKLIDKGDYDVVHIYNLHPTWAAAQVAFLCKRRGIKTVLACHGIHETANRASVSKIKGLLVPAVYLGVSLPLKYLVKNSTMIFASTAADFPVLEKLGAKKENIRIVTNGVDKEYFIENSPEQLETVRAKYKLPSDKPLLVFVGHLRPKKCVDILLQAAAKVRGDFHLVIVGPDSFPEHFKMLMQLVDELKLDQTVTFTKRVPLADLSVLYQLADIFVLPSRSETLPLSIMEAMAKSKPVIASAVGGIPHQVNEETGILVQPEDVDDLAGAIDRLLREPETRKAMGAAGRVRLMKEFTWKHAAEKALAGYRDLNAGNGKGIE